MRKISQRKQKQYKKLEPEVRVAYKNTCQKAIYNNKSEICSLDLTSFRMKPRWWGLSPLHECRASGL